MTKTLKLTQSYLNYIKKFSSLPNPLFHHIVDSTTLDRSTIDIPGTAICSLESEIIERLLNSTEEKIYNVRKVTPKRIKMSTAFTLGHIEITNQRKGEILLWKVKNPIELKRQIDLSKVTLFARKDQQVLNLPLDAINYHILPNLKPQDLLHLKSTCVSWSDYLESHRVNQIQKLFRMVNKHQELHLLSVLL